MKLRKKLFSLFLTLCLMIQPLTLTAAAADKDYGPIPEENCGVPLFFQTDYPDIKYGDGSIATSGCGVTCLAMAATYMTGFPYTPDVLTEFFGGYGKNNIERLEYGSEQLQLPWRKAKDFYEAYDALKDGNLAIIMMRSPSLFTTTQHFILAAGLNEDGLIMINDPLEYHYQDPDIARALREGFRIGDMLYGFSDAWIYDVNAMPEEPYIYNDGRYDNLNLSWTDRTLLAKLLWVEVRDKSADCQQAVAEVMLNRMISWDFSPEMIYNIDDDSSLTPTTQLTNVRPSPAQYDIIDRALTGPHVAPKNVVYFGEVDSPEHEWNKIEGLTFWRLY